MGDGLLVKWNMNNPCFYSIHFMNIGFRGAHKLGGVIE